MKSAAYPIHEVSFRVQRSDIEFSLDLPSWAQKNYLSRVPYSDFVI